STFGRTETSSNAVWIRIHLPFASLGRYRMPNYTVRQVSKTVRENFDEETRVYAITVNDDEGEKIDFQEISEEEEA
ncbi:MAG: hypothetical protein ACE5QW_09680, partial [Thermoplasmata archaeon]